MNIEASSEGTEESEGYPPKGNGPFDSRAEEAIDWYQHYMAIEVEDLALEYLSKRGSPEGKPSPMMEKAVEERFEEAGKALLGEEEFQ